MSKKLQSIGAGLLGLGILLTFVFGHIGLLSCTYETMQYCGQGQQVFKIGFIFSVILIFGGGVMFAVFTIKQNPWKEESYSEEVIQYDKEHGLWCDILNCAKSECSYCYNGIEHKRTPI
jgi:hypothetical protein